jgi:hypothetical protein
LGSSVFGSDISSWFAEIDVDTCQSSDKPDASSDLVGRISVTGAGFGSSVEFASSSIQRKWGCKLVKIDHLCLELDGCRHFGDPQ